MTDTPIENATRGGAQGPGRLIRQAREQARLSIEDLGGQIKLARGTLDALERDDFTTLSMPVYVRGYYRKLSKVLPLSETELIAAYESLVAPKAPTPPSKLILAGGHDLASGRSFNPRLVLAVVVVGLLLALAAFWGTRSTAPVAAVQPAVTETPAPIVSPAPDALPPDAPVEQPVAPSVGDVQPSPVEISPEPAPAALTLAPALSQRPPAPAAAPAATPAAAVTAPAGRAELLMQFNATSWARVEDATGQSLLSGVIQSGELQTLSGQAPFSIFLGNATGVSVKLNGQAVDMGKYTQGNNTARFTLP